ncbi:MAG: peptidylprolyl isomerase [Planctomycetes bacterium]|nr:peptidylprolyl isomerase [Planctomycetota bacterium]
MKPKTTLILIVAFVLLFGATWLLENNRKPTPGRGERTARELLKSFSKADAQRIDLSEKEKKLTLSKKDKGWVVDDAGGYTADSTTVDGLLDKLEKMTTGALVSQNPANQATLEVDAATDVCTVEQQLRWAYKPDTLTWLDRRVFSFETARLQSLSIKGPSGEAAMTKDAQGNWSLTAPRALPAQKLVVENVVTTLSMLTLTEVAPARELKEYGLDQPRWTFSFELTPKSDEKKAPDDKEKKEPPAPPASNEKYAIHVGSAKDADNYYAKREDSSAVIVIAKYSVDAVGKPPNDFIDRTVFGFNSEDLATLSIAGPEGAAELVKKESGWEIISPAPGPAHPAKLRDAVQMLGTLKALHIADEKPEAEYGLEEASAYRIAMKMKDESKKELWLGKSVENVGTYAKCGSAGKVVYVLAAADVARFRLKQEDLPAPPAEVLPLVVIHTDKGDILLELFEEDAPNSVANFINLIEKKFYDGLAWHRVIADFMIQGGDPNSRDADPSNDGQGGPGYRIRDEFSARKHERGTLSMANSGPDTNGSQFFITHKPTEWLDGKHSVFGRVLSGQDVVDKIQQGDKMTSIEVRQKRNHPYEPVKLGDSAPLPLMRHLSRPPRTPRLPTATRRMRRRFHRPRTSRPSRRLLPRAMLPNGRGIFPLAPRLAARPPGRDPDGADVTEVTSLFCPPCAP